MNHQSFTGPKIWSPILFFSLLLLTGCQAARTARETLGEVDSASNCYQVELLDYKWISEVATTWRYRVGQPACAQTVNSWILELPACATVVEAAPADWQIAAPDLKYQLSGVEWQPGTDLQNGEFSVTLLGNLSEGMTRAGVEGQGIFMSQVKGPVCQTQAGVPATAATANVPIAKVKVQSTNCRAVPAAKAQKIALLYRGQEAEIIGRNDDPKNPWWYVNLPDPAGNCWLWGQTVTTTGSLENVPTVQ